MPRFRRASDLVRRATGGRVHVEWRRSNEVEHEAERERRERERIDRAHRRLFGTLLVVAVVATVAGLFLSWRTWFGLNHATGNVAAVADAMLHGESPAHPDRSALRATFYFPAQPALLATVRTLGLGWLDALRGLALLGLAALAVATAAAARALGGGVAGASLAAALVLVAGPVALAGLAGRADLFAAACSVGAFAAWAGDRRGRAAWIAPALAACAVAFKATAVALPIAVVAHAWIARRPFAPFGFAWRFAVAAAAVMVVLMPWQGGAWLGESLSLLRAAPPSSTFVLRGPAELIRYLGSYAELAVLAAAAIAFAAGHRKAALFAGASTLVAVAVLGYRLADHNHLIEAIAAAAACTGALAAGARGDVRRFALALAAIVVVAAAWRDLHSTWRHARDPAERRAAVIAAVAAEPGEVLAEDPLLPLAAGRRPVVADAALVRSLAWRGDPRVAPLRQAIETRRFGLVVLQASLDDAAWYRDFHFGDSLHAALAAGYVESGRADGFVLARPRASGAAPAAVATPADTLAHP